jgi:hypothetical protein
MNVRGIYCRRTLSTRKSARHREIEIERNWWYTSEWREKEIPKTESRKSEAKRERERERACVCWVLEYDPDSKKPKGVPQMSVNVRAE